jgi:hypothetical protein
MIFFAVSAGLCQTPANQPDTLQSLLTEVHQLRQAIENLTIASQRVQIALYSLQLQDGAVARAAKRMDDAHAKCVNVQNEQDHEALDVRNLENALSVSTLKPEEKKDLENRLAFFKNQADARSVTLQTCQGTEAEATTQMQAEQAKLAELQSRIERLDKVLEKMADSGRSLP